MDFLELAKERYSVRRFSEEPLAPDAVEKLLTAARLAPTGCNNQPQRILVLNGGRENEGIKKLKGCTKCHFDAPAAMLVCYHTGECWRRPYDGKTSGVIDASIVATHILLEAAQIGVGATWVMHFDPAVMRKAFHIPEEIEPVALLVMGYPAPDAAPLPLHSTYRPDSETTVYDTF